MQQFHKIHPLPLCTQTMDKGAFTYLTFGYYGEKVSITVYAWLIEGAEEPILVDVGCSAEEFVKYAVFSKEVKDVATIEESLARFGISTLDIKTIIMTHLHADHILNAKKFPNARFIVQEEELRFARNPHPLDAHRYHKELYDKLNFRTITGDTEIIPGVETIFTPGHSVGGQSVAVATEQGKVVICGLCTIDENFSAEGDIITGIHTNPYEAYDSIVKIRKIADSILPLHSQSLLHTISVP
ncbi:MAG: N-acyl homoserine lactonase family protein [Desulfobacteraceae bacterium]|nr:N-acyl homoserine lactonase family protein [Desulfobacteraceae bacterium]